MPQIGQIISWPNYKFPDGGTSPKKLFIVLNDALSDDSPCLLLITTSQEKWYLNYKEGCNHNLNMFYIQPNSGECLPEKTFVELPFIIEKTCKELWGQFEDGVRVWGRKLSRDCMNNLKECLKTFEKDISPKHYSLIFS